MDEIIVNGVRVGPSTDLAALVKRQILDGSVLANRYDDIPDQGVWSLFAAAKGTAIEGRLVETIRSLLLDPDARVRSGAVRIAQAFPERFQAPDLLGVLVANPVLFDGVATEAVDEPDLAWGLLRAIAASSNWNDDVAKRLRSAALDHTNGVTVLAGLVDHDADWVTEHAQELIDDQPNRARVILFQLRQRNQRERLIRAIPKESPKLRKLVAKAVDQEVIDPVERTQLLNLLR